MHPHDHQVAPFVARHLQDLLGGPAHRDSGLHRHGLSELTAGQAIEGCLRLLNIVDEHTL
jgi:hypothetical protein